MGQNQSQIENSDAYVEGQQNLVKSQSQILMYRGRKRPPMSGSDPEQAQQFANSIKRFVNVQEVEKSFFNENIESQGLNQIGIGLQNCCKLQSITFDFRRNAIGSESPHLDFAQAISASKDHLKNINLDFGINQLQNESPKSLIQSISKCSNLEQLFLGFSANNISSQFSQFFEGFQNIKNLRFFHLDLSQNGMVQAEIAKIIEKISNLNQLESLKFNLQKIQLSQVSMMQISENLNKIKNLKYLELNLQWNNLGNVGIKQLDFSNLQCLETLTLLLGWTQIDGAGLFNLITNISNSKSLKQIELELKFNKLEQNLNHEQIKIMSHINYLRSMVMHVRKNTLSSEGLAKIIQLITSFFNIEHLQINAEANELNKDLDQLGQALSQLKTKSLDLNFEENEIDNAGLVQLFNKFSSNDNLEKLNFNFLDNKINHLCYEQFGHALSQFNRLNHLKIQLNKLDDQLKCHQTKELLKYIFESKSINHLHCIIPPSINDNKLMKQLYQQCKKAKYLVSYSFTQK